MSTEIWPSRRKSCDRLQLRRVAVDERKRGIRGGKSVRPDLAVLRRRIVRVDQRHVAVGALRRLLRVVERARALARHAGRLPVVVVVESAEPAVAVHRHVEVNLVAARAELGRLVAVERLEERSLDAAADRCRSAGRGGTRSTGFVLAARSCSGGYSISKSPWPIVLPNVRDRMARRARETGLRFGRVDLFLDRPVEAAVEEDRVIVAAGTPLRRLCADDVLHVLDRLAVPLVVERREVVHRRLPLRRRCPGGTGRNSRWS